MIDVGMEIRWAGVGHHYHYRAALNDRVTGCIRYTRWYFTLLPGQGANQKEDDRKQV